MEPERNIEKWLRAFARKRRADAGDPFRLHPATRRRLQAEVTKQFAEPPEEESLSLWQLFRRQWALLLGFAVVIFFVATMFAPALSKAKNKSRQVAAASQLKEIGAAAQIAAEENNGKLPATLDALTNGLLSDKALTDPVSGKRFVYAAAGEILDELQSNSVLAYSPEDKKGRALLLADGTVQTVKEETFDVIKRRGLVQRTAPMEIAANAPVPTTAPVVSSGTMTVVGVAGSGGGGAADSFGLGVGQTKAKPAAEVAMARSAAGELNGNAAALAQKQFYFRTLNEKDADQTGERGDTLRFKLATATPARTPAVLANFEVRQDSNNLTIVDRDGSVYSGSIGKEIVLAQTPAPVAEPPPEEKTKATSLAKSETGSGQMAKNQFRVTGQNRTTKQNVVFTGTAIPAPVTNGISLSPFFNARITGTLTLDETNRIEINAVPATP